MNVVEPISPGAQQIQFALLRLKNWPDLPQLPAEDVVDLARVCALLSMRATAGLIIARMLDMPKERVQQVLAQLHALGCLNLQAHPTAAATAQSAAASAANDSVAPPENSFITKIWQRLAAKN